MLNHPQYSNRLCRRTARNRKDLSGESAIEIHTLTKSNRLSCGIIRHCSTIASKREDGLFKIPIELDSTTVCLIRAHSDLAEMIRRTRLIIWDEAPMTHKHAFEAVDRTLRDITKREKPFGGFCDVRRFQTSPALKKGLRPGLRIYQRIPSLEQSGVLCIGAKTYVLQLPQLFHKLIYITIRLQTGF